MAFRRANTLANTPARGRENFDQSFNPNIALKDGLAASGRKHNRPKQAFGELKNVFHNHEQNFSNNIKKNIFQNSETPKCQQQKINIFRNLENPKCEQKKNIKCNLKYESDNFEDNLDYDTLPKYEYKGPEEYWAKQIALTVEECDRILAPQFERTETITQAEVRDIIKHDREELGDNTLEKLLDLEFQNHLDDMHKLNDDIITMPDRMPDLQTLTIPEIFDWEDLLL